jgi:hypothetical protein
MMRSDLQIWFFLEIPKPISISIRFQNEASTNLGFVHNRIFFFL